MRNAFGILVILLTASLAMSFASPAGAPAHLFGRIVGTYEGVVVDGGNLVAQTTRFSTGKDGRPVATYLVKHPDGTTYSGTFQDAYVVDKRTVTFKWADKHGEGVVMLTFTPDGASFDGTWGIDQVAANNEIRGARQ